MKFMTFYLFAVFLIAELSAIDEIYHVSPKTYKRLHQILPQAHNSSPSSSNSSTVYIIVDNVFTVLYSNNLEYCRHREPRLGDFCSSNKDCKGLSHSICSSNSCKCAPIYRQEGNSCLGLINGKCSKDQECAIKGSKCLKNSCQCPDGFYLDEICRKYASLNGECKSKEGCAHIPFSSCVDGKCLCRQNYQESFGSCLGLLYATCNNSADCGTTNAICDGICQCPENFDFEDNNCYQLGIGSTECGPGYYKDRTVCYSIPSDYETPVDSAIACNYLSYAYYANGKCHSSSQNLNEFCYDNRACKTKFSECLSHKCHCKEGYIERNGSCLSLMNTECFWDEECGIEGSKCIDNFCQCPYDFYLDKICIKYGELFIIHVDDDGNVDQQRMAGLERKCKSEEQCKHIPYSSCSNGECLCRPNYEDSSGSCLGLVNTPCNKSTECIANAICEGTCRCSSNSYEENHHCYKIPTDYKTSVNSAKACQFLDDAHYISGACYKNRKLKESCIRDHQCGDSFSECSNRECKCKDKYFEHKNRCYAPIGGECKIDNDCSTIWYSCVSGICQQSLYEKKDGNKYSSKPGATARWEPDEYLINPENFRGQYLKQYFQRRESTTGDVGHLAWVDNYTLDRVIAYHNSDSNSLSILCRQKYPMLATGVVKFPGDGLCHVNNIHSDKITFVDYEVYVDLGPQRSTK